MSDVTATRPLENVTRMSDRRRSAAFFTVLTAVVLEVADTTIVNTALPAIRDALGASSAHMQWIVAGYLLALGSLLLLGGKLGDALGHSRVFLWGVAGFVITSVFCGLARDPQELVIARLLQGAFGAIMAPQTMAIIQLLYTPLERVKQLAYFGVVLGLAAIIGPVAGGLLIELNAFDLGWRVIFLINLPIGIGAIIVGFFVLPEAEEKARLRIDPLGALVFAAGFGGLLFALIEAAENGTALYLGVIGAVAAGLLIWGWRRAIARRAVSLPSIVEPALFKIPTFSWSTWAAFGFSSSALGFLLVFAISLQQGLGLSPLDTAMVHVPFGAGVMLGVGLLVPKFLPRIGKVLPAAGGVLMMVAISAVMVMIARGDGGSVLLLIILSLAGIGMGTLSGPLGAIVVADVSRKLAGTASATFRTAQQIGGAIGIALVGGAYFSGGALLVDAAQGEGEAAARLLGLYPALGLVLLLLGFSTFAVGRLPKTLFAKETD